MFLGAKSWFSSFMVKVAYTIFQSGGRFTYFWEQFIFNQWLVIFENQSRQPKLIKNKKN